MLAAARPELGHLTYCTNIHAAETWPEVRASLSQQLPAIRREAAPGKPFGVGQRRAASAAQALENAEAMAELQALLQAENCYVFTLNGFPYGSFHSTRVKEEVYAPDWSTPERLTYTNLLADILAVLVPEGMAGSISTVPGTFGLWAEGRVGKIVENLVRHAAHLSALEKRTGRTLALALEPEPRCLLETIDETATFFETELYGAGAVSLMAELTGLSQGAAAEALRRHLGVCYDVCHAAVEFEDARASIELLRSKGIPIPKLQLSAALKVDRMDAEAARLLRPFDERVYLHQVVARNGAGLMRYTDLPQALADIDRTLGSEWRVHFHVPIFLDEMERFSTTQDFLREVLALHRQRPISDHLEVETYTWDVLPERYRGTPVAEAIARELAWVRQQLGA
jgi:hypothetical protein